MGKEVEHGWYLTLTNDSFCNINNMGVVVLRVADQFSVNEKVDHYTKRRTTHDYYFPGP